MRAHGSQVRAQVCSLNPHVRCPGSPPQAAAGVPAVVRGDSDKQGRERAAVRMPALSPCPGEAVATNRDGVFASLEGTSAGPQETRDVTAPPRGCTEPDATEQETRLVREGAGGGGRHSQVLGSPSVRGTHGAGHLLGTGSLSQLGDTTLARSRLCFC